MATGILISSAAILAFAGLLVWAAIGDLRHYEIPNWLCLAIAGVFPAFALGHGLQSSDLSLSNHLWVAAISFFICFGLFAAGIMGGGDAKLIPGVALWSGTGLLSEFLLVMSLSGGALALAIFVYRQIGKRSLSQAALDARATLARSDASPLPYGVAIAAGGLAVAFDLLRTGLPAATTGA